jgi:hypothetical protein
MIVSTRCHHIRRCHHNGKQDHAILSHWNWEGSSLRSGKRSSFPARSKIRRQRSRRPWF